MRNGRSPEALLLLLCCLFAIAFTLSACSQALKTPAVYIEHTGDEDKPVDPIVIATRRPSGREIRHALTRRAARLDLQFVHVFVVKDEELAHVEKLVGESLANTKPTEHLTEFRYVVVAENREVKIGSLDYDRSRELFAALATHFDGRQPQLHELLTEGLNWFWRWYGYDQPNKSSKSLRQKFAQFGTIPTLGLLGDV